MIFQSDTEGKDYEISYKESCCCKDGIEVLMRSRRIKTDDYLTNIG